MQAVFSEVLKLSLTASYITLAVIVIRLLLKKAPRCFTTALWGIVAIRLFLPFSIESIFSVIPPANTLPTINLTTEAPTLQSEPTIHIGTDSVFGFTPSDNPTITDSVTSALNVLSIIWLIGIAAMLIYCIVQYVRIKRQVAEAIPVNDRVYICENIPSPFIFGAFNPRIYLPATLNEQGADLIICHEQAHLKRLDHLWKPFGFMLLTIHWFNPLLWLAFILFCKDIEIACDEKVIREKGVSIKKEYSEILLNCSIDRKRVAAYPLAFGEAGIKERIKAVLHYKKPIIWIVVICIIVLVIAAVCLLTNPIDTSSSISTVGGVDEPTHIKIESNNSANASGLQEGYAYGYHYQSENDSSYISLVPEKQGCFFSYSLLSSYSVEGSYTENNISIVVSDNSGNKKYTFKKSGDDLIFDAESSSALPEYAYSSGAEPIPCIPDGAVFKRISMDKLYIDKVIADVDGDGIKEECILDYGPTSGLFTFKLKISENGKLEYYNVFYPEHYGDLNLNVMDGELKIELTTQGLEPNTYTNTAYTYDISLEGEKIIASYKGEPIPTWGTWSKAEIETLDQNFTNHYFSATYNNLKYELTNNKLD